MNTETKKIGYRRYYIIPLLATLGMILFALFYEPVAPLWWVLATVGVAIGYGYYFKKAQGN